MNKDFLKQWIEVDKELFTQMIKLVNGINMKRIKQKEFDEFVFNNEDKLKNPDYAGLFVEQATLLDEYYEDHEKVCDYFYELLSRNDDWEKLDFSLRTFIRLSTFMEEYNEFKEKRSKKQ